MSQNATSTRFLNTSRDGDSTAALGSLFQQRTAAASFPDRHGCRVGCCLSPASACHPSEAVPPSREAFCSQPSLALWVTSCLSPRSGRACAGGRSRGSHGAVPAWPVLSIRVGAWSLRAALAPSGPCCGVESGEKTWDSSPLTAKGDCLVGFQAEGAQNGEAALNPGREAAPGESRGEEKNICES